MKRLIVCCDGTWNSRERGRPTNVEKIAQAILPTAPDGTSQIVFYDQGVGTGARVAGDPSYRPPELMRHLD